MLSANCGAGFGRLALAKFAALLLVTALLMPLFLFSAAEKTTARGPKPAETIIRHAPPEPFVLNSVDNETGLSTRLTVAAASIAASAVSILAGVTIRERSINDDAREKPVEKSAASDDSEEASGREETEESLTEAEIVSPPPASTVDFDFDGDGKADIGRWHSSNAEFKVRKSSDGGFLTNTLGSSSAIPVPGDYDGTTPKDYETAVFDNGTWTISGLSSISLGQSGDIPVSGDFDGDGKTDAAVFRPSNSTWYIKRSTDGGTSTQGWGLSGDIPAPGDFDEDGKTDYAVFRPSNGNWWILKSGGGTYNRGWGLSGDVPVPADYDGDGATDIAVYRPSSGTWYVATSVSGFDSTFSQTWGIYGDQPVPANYDGDAYCDMAVWRPSTGTWHILKSSTSALQTYNLGESGDLALPSSFLEQSAFEVPADDLGKERLIPRNATGGTNLYSQNFSWGTSLVGLPGRSGLDMGFGIGYNSLVWTKVGSAMVFDADAGGLTPGFRFGFPVIEPVFQNLLAAGPPEVKKFTYMMISPSGARVEFRQTSDAGIYETVDGSYAKLQTFGATDPNDPADAFTIIVTTTDGTQMSYEWAGGAFRCKEIKDRNGNKITIVHDEFGNLQTVTDTLGRVVTVNYAYGAPSSITQTWKTANGSGSNTTYTWATFSYTTVDIDTNFNTSLSVIGPSDGWDVPVLERITYADGSSTKFYYNGYAQVKRIENIAADSPTHILNYTETNLDTPQSPADDCPRFTQVRTAAENFNGGQPMITNLVQTTNQSFTLPGSLANSGTLITVQMTGHPHNAVSKSIVSSSGWSEGLTIASEDWADGTSGSERKRWTWANWTQDDTTAGYSINPRVTETRVGDGANTKKTQVDYHLVGSTNVAEYGLVKEVRTYKADLANEMKRVRIDYVTGSAYLNKRIIGLPSLVQTWGFNDESTNLEYAARTVYAYDEGDFNDSTLTQTIAPSQHDSTNYGASFIAGRGNLTSTTRCDASLSSTSCVGGITTSVKYNTAGSVVAQITPWDGTQTRTVKVDYADDFNSSGNPTTYAYPTKIYDPAGNYSQVEYRYDIGANVEASSPAPEGNDFGKRTTRLYDSLGRLDKDSVWRYDSSEDEWIEYAYSRHDYPTNGVQSKVYSTPVDANSNGEADTADEVLSESWTDGAGRVRFSRRPHSFDTNGAAVTWAGVLTEYDILGRTKRQSMPTETNSSWNPTGDDYRGMVGSDYVWLWNSQEYDWMGRTTRAIPSDSTGSDGKDTLISYAGCGCAGGLVTTVQGPVTTAVDVAGNTQTTKRRTQKIYEDIIGRTYKIENWDLDGAGSVPYSTKKTWFNERDQATVVWDYAGGESSSTVQNTNAGYDGYGRLASSHKPEQRVGSTPEYTTYNYNLDGSVQSVTDARGAVRSMMYNSRGLVTNVSNQWSGAPSQPTRKNFALLTNGAIPSASSIYGADYPMYSAFDGDRTGSQWGSLSGGAWVGGGWNDNTLNSYPDWLQIEFPSAKTIDEVKVVTLQDNYQTAGEPDENTTFTQLGITEFDVQYWDGDSWENVSGGSVTGNDNVIRKFEFSPVITTKVRVVVNYSLSAQYRYSRIVELEAWGNDDPPPLQPEISYAYDNAGNRTSMTDEMGDAQYEYNSLGQMTAETRGFNDAMPSAPLSNNRFKIQYEYSPSGLKSYTDPFGQQINYNNDKIGRVSSVTGSSFGGVTTYASNPTYRAWGGLKSATFTGGIDMELAYDNRLRVASMGLQKADDSWLMDKDYTYYSDGKLKFLDDAVNANFDRLNIYDHVGRIREAKSGGEARGETVSPEDRDFFLPYRQTYEFDTFAHLTESTNMHWGVTSWGGFPFAQTESYVNNRIQKTGWEFDDDGRITKAISDSGDITLTTFDATGKPVQTATAYRAISQTYYDGNGSEVKRAGVTANGDGLWTQQPTKYFIRSSVMKGQVISEVWANGKKHRSYVKGIGNQTAVQTAYNSETATLSESVIFEYADASGMSYRTVDKNGAAVATGDGGEGSPIETDPLGGSVGTFTPYFEPVVWQPEPDQPLLLVFGSGGGSNNIPGMDFGSLYATFGSRIADLPGFGTNWGSFLQLAEQQYSESVWNAWHGWGFNTNEQLGGPPGARLTAPIWGHRNGRTDDTPSGGQTFGDDEVVAVDTDWGIVDWEWVQTTDEWKSFFTILKPNMREHYVFFRDLENARSALGQLMSSNGGRCGQAIEALLRQLNGRSTNLLDVFDDVKEGLMINSDESAYDSRHRELTGRDRNPVAGGGGLTGAIPEQPATKLGSFMLSAQFATFYSTQSSHGTGKATRQELAVKEMDAMKQALFRLTHELVHAAGRSTAIPGPELGKAIEKLDPTIPLTTGGEGSLNAYLKKNCPFLLGTNESR